MFKTYILQSLKDDSFYYGYTKDLENRLKEHNPGRVRYNKARKLWKIFYFEEFETKSLAYQREMFF